MLLPAKVTPVVATLVAATTQEFKSKRNMSFST
jgi:hypothetical protein